MLPTIDTATLIEDALKFLPELIVCFAVVFLLVLRLFKLFNRTHLGAIALVLTVCALVVGVSEWGVGGIAKPVFESFGDRDHQAYDKAAEAVGAVGFSALPPPATEGARAPMLGLLAYDHLTVFLRCFLLGFAALIILLTMRTGIPDREDSGDFYCLLLGATLGMMLMASANHLLMIFIAVEMASLPSYALAGFLKGRRQSSEAALKYVVYGGGAAGVMLYGISLLAGKFGTGYLPDLAAGYVQALPTLDPVLLLGTLFVLIGVAFKLAAVPFHFWCPDVFEGASAEVAGFLSVASKGAALALLIRVTLVLTGFDRAVTQGPQDAAAWLTVVRYLVPALAVFAALTATFGNLAAYLQNNLKRLLAYSTIAHAGYMMMGVCALTAPRVYEPGGKMVVGPEAVLFYLIAYLFMNLGAFAVVAFLRNQAGSENLSDLRGLVRRSPWMVVTLAFFLLSLLGIPPLVGFAAKFQIFSSLYNAGLFYYQHGETGLCYTLIGLLIVGGLNTVLSAVYYLKVLKVMIIEGRAEDLEGQEPQRLREPAGNVVYAGLVALAVVGLGLFWGPMSDASRKGVERFVPTAPAAAPPPMGPPGPRGLPGAPGLGGPRPGGPRPGVETLED
jgi:NADH-quinone oxidoreductase subunit N